MTIIAPAAVRPARLSDAPLPAVDPHRPPWPGELVRVRGAELFVRRTPGPDAGREHAVYVHGLGGSSTNWTDLADLLRGRLSGDALDLPGFGRSGPAPGQDYTLAGHARTVISYLEHRVGEPVHLLGNSLGGAVTVLVAAMRPDLIRTLTLVSPAMPSLRPRRGSDLTLPLLLLPGLGRLVQRRLDALPPQQRARAVLELCFGDPSAVPDNRFEEAVEEVVRRRGVPWAMDAFTASLRGVARSYTVSGERSLWRQAAQVRAPSLVIWGDRDKVVSATLAPRTAATLPDSRLLVLPGIGHVAQMEVPDVVARAVVALLEDAG
ncbi:MAG: alpha/beta fold hydrolase [Mycobacteriales bacterium]